MAKTNGRFGDMIELSPTQPFWQDVKKVLQLLDTMLHLKSNTQNLQGGTRLRLCACDHPGKAYVGHCFFHVNNTYIDCVAAKINPKTQKQHGLLNRFRAEAAPAVAVATPCNHLGFGRDLGLGPLRIMRSFKEASTSGNFEAALSCLKRRQS